MHRARQRFLAAAAACAAALAAPSAWAYHAGSMFDKPPGAGGAGGIFYTGAPLEKGWECSMCHQEAPGRIKVRLRVEPSSLFDDFRYTPGETYTFTATLEGEHLGLGSPFANYNSLVVTFVDQNGFSTGNIGGFAAEDFYQGNPSTIASAGLKAGETEWSFQWTAGSPDFGPSHGPITLHLAAVDGNGAESGPTGTLTDPFGDDVFTAKVQFQEAGASSGARMRPSRPGTFLCALGLAAVGINKRRRKSNSKEQSRPMGT